MKPFARYNDADNHDQLVRGLFKEKRIRERMKYLSHLQGMGFEKLYEGEEAQKGH
jgi:RecB family endonuclease NucS